MARATLGVLVPWLGATPEPPEDRPLGRVALAVEADGIDLVFGSVGHEGRLTGFRARPGRWEPVADAPIVAAYDRFPARGQPEVHQRLLAGLAGVPVANDPALVERCRDKLGAQQAMERVAAMPEVEADPARFAAALARWGAGFLKPRFGSFGAGISRVVPGDPLPAEVASTGPVGRDPALLQRAIDPPEGWAGASVRVLVQRDVDGTWVSGAPVLRRSRTDPVVNAARGADIEALDEVWPGTVDPVVRLAVLAAGALTDDPRAVELGVDVVLDRELRPWVVEVNGTPRGRLERLAAQDPRWWAAHLETCARPLRYLARRFG